MLDLGKIREEIDIIDSGIVRLFTERMALVEQVARYKIENGRQVFDAEREKAKLAEVCRQADNPFNAKGVQEIFTQLMSISRKRQYQLLDECGAQEEADYTQVDALPATGARVVFQGVEGAYSFAAMKTFFDETIRSFHVATWKEAMEKISAGEADYAVLPIENSTAGIVSDIYDLLVEYPHYIVGEQVIPVAHVLMGVPGAKLSDIREVYSHPQGLAQCKVYLDQHPEWKRKEVLNTAVAAQQVAEGGDPSKAAIASRYAAEHFGLAVLDEGIFSNRANATRFVILSGHPVYVRSASKVSICFEIPHESGSLYSILSHFIYNDLNMTKIESRPIPGRNWEYRFFVDFEGNLADSAVRNALRGVRTEATHLRVFGNY